MHSKIDHPAQEVANQILPLVPKPPRLGILILKEEIIKVHNVGFKPGFIIKDQYLRKGQFKSDHEKHNCNDKWKENSDICFILISLQYVARKN